MPIFNDSPTEVPPLQNSLEFKWWVVDAHHPPLKKRKYFTNMCHNTQNKKTQRGCKHPSYKKQNVNVFLRL